MVRTTVCRGAQGRARATDQKSGILSVFVIGFGRIVRRLNFDDRRITTIGRRSRHFLVKHRITGRANVVLWLRDYCHRQIATLLDPALFLLWRQLAELRKVFRFRTFLFGVGSATLLFRDGLLCSPKSLSLSFRLGLENGAPLCLLFRRNSPRSLSSVDAFNVIACLISILVAAHNYRFENDRITRKIVH